VRLFHDSQQHHTYQCRHPLLVLTLCVRRLAPDAQ
jgi:hypothetical protein